VLVAEVGLAAVAADPIDEIQSLPGTFVFGPSIAS
jgi:hypothetical protein